ncbi:MAG: hypothetical protein C4541_11915 [Candidatus Auribacter fodinae]|jgi:NTE family protein|uniref:Cyclic nucleotide-binding domain-containing protein n=1 Tax=Candidatus Auribacter fodinae TaxID=2093366 RepID=A0A3A4QX59_9BACT|nr:MAG: hypothetical protein C4541_11915 [Candidatus Auribacter fodinae]
MTHEFVPTLSRVPLFADFTDQELSEIAPYFKMVTIRRNKNVLSINEEGKFLYILKYGQVKIVVPNEKDGSEDILASLGPGNYFGEMSLLTGEPVSATVKTSLDSEFLILGKESFTTLLKQYSKLSFSISMILSKRLRERNVFQSFESLPETVSVFSQTGGSFSAKLSFLLGLFLHHEGLGRVLIIDAGGTDESFIHSLAFSEAKEKLDAFIDSHDIGESLRTVVGKLYQYSNESEISRHFGLTMKKTRKTRVKELHVNQHDSYSYDQGLYWLKVTEKDTHSLMLSEHVSPLLSLVAQIYDVILLDLGNMVSATTARALSQSDKNIVLAERNIQSLQIVSDKLKKLCRMEETKLCNTSFILFQPEKSAPDTNILPAIKKVFPETLVSLNTLPFTLDYCDTVTRNENMIFSRTPAGRCIGRLAREITGATVGVALGGGGARGYAHIGALKLLEEENVPVDVMAGSSMGSLVGAVYCMTGSAAETERILRTELAESGSIFDLTLPVTSFLRGKRIRAISEAIFKKMTFSDLIIPFYVVCVDLISGQEIVINEGSVSQAVQASSAIPGIFKPVRVKDKYLVDGSVINKVPANVLQRYNAHNVISVNVTPDRDSFMEARIAEPEGVGKLIRRIPFIKDMLDEPNILQIINRSLNITNTQMSRVGAQYTNYEIKPIIEHFDFLNFKMFDPVVEAGYVAARKSLEEIKKIIQ